MRIIKNALVVGVATMLLVAPTTSYGIGSYLTEDEYNQQLAGTIYEDRGIVLENHPSLGYMVYRNARGEKVTAQYYSKEMVVEKAPFDEQEDKIGYIDEMFPSFSYDSRDTTIEHIWPGDNVYVRMDKEGYITYISAFNDYTIRYGKVHTFVMGAESFNTLVLEDGSGKLYSYKVPKYVPITKGDKPYSLGQLKEGEWIKVLVSQQILGQGIIEESVKEIVVDADSRVIENIYRGELLAANSYRKDITLKNSQVLHKNGWGPYTQVMQLSIDPRTVRAYFLGNPISFDKVAKQMPGAGGYVYVAAENYMGGKQAVKLNFQDSKQRTLEPTTITYAGPGVIRLMTGEEVFLSADTILVRDNRLVGPGSAMVGDTIQGVISGENKLAVGRIIDDVESGMLQVFRGRVKEVADYNSFEVETFSMLQEGEWYFHPTPRTFAINANTKLYDTKGVVTKGIASFLTYGEHSKEKEVYTIIAKGDEAAMIVDMPYTKESIQGEVYATEGGIKLRNVYTYNRAKDRYEQLSKKNKTVDVELLPNTVIIKEGKLVSQAALEIGDKLTVMMEKKLGESKKDDDTTGGNTDAKLSTPGYVILVH